MEVILFLIGLMIFAEIYTTIRAIRRRILMDKLLKDEQKITQYMREDMEKERNK